MKSTLTSLRSLAVSRLMQYRRYRNFLREQRINVRAAGSPADRGASHALRPAAPSARELTQMRGWVRAIERVRDKLRTECPKKSDFMDRCFCLDMAKPIGSTPRARIIALSMSLCISESTAYKWREDILDLVLFSAIEAGLLKPFSETEEGETE